MSKGKIEEKFEGPFDGHVKRYSNMKYKGLKCPYYSECPICSRCESKNTKYEWCRNCKVKTCEHTTKQKNMIGGDLKYANQK